MQTNSPLLTLALGKGRMFDDTLALLERLGYAMEPVRTAKAERKMIAIAPPFRVLLAKDPDVPIYVEQGAADLGVAGRDVVWESGVNVLVPLALGDAMPASRCRMALISPRATRDRNWRLAHDLMIATKYPAITREYVNRTGLGAQVIGLSGNIELAPACGMADLIVDIVQTGTTLRENDLVEIETILECEASLIVNRAAQKLRPTEIRAIVERLENAIGEGVATPPLHR